MEKGGAGESRHREVSWRRVGKAQGWLVGIIPDPFAEGNQSAGDPAERPSVCWPVTEDAFSSDQRWRKLFGFRRSYARHLSFMGERHSHSMRV